MPARRRGDRPASRRGEVAMLFGREDNGLSNEELMRCNLHLAIPTSDVYSSLNLAMAVQIVCYELHMLAAGEALPASPTPMGCAAGHAGNMERFFVHLEETLRRSAFSTRRRRGSSCRACAASTAGCASMRWN
jgi:tRNA (cytidine32/uridine32-2'-O)-methyltransferase